MTIQSMLASCNLCFTSSNGISNISAGANIASQLADSFLKQLELFFRYEADWQSDACSSRRLIIGCERETMITGDGDGNVEINMAYNVSGAIHGSGSNEKAACKWGSYCRRQRYTWSLHMMHGPAVSGMWKERRRNRRLRMNSGKGQEV